MIQNKVLFIIFISFVFGKIAFSQEEKEIVQINGITMSADSIDAVPFVTVSVKNQNRGVVSNQYGIFSLVCYKGDTLIFSSIGYRNQEVKVDPKITGRFINLIQLMVQDTFYLPETVINPIPKGKAFDYAFKYWDIENDPYVIAKKNTNAEVMSYLRNTLPKSGRENQAVYQMREATNTFYYGQQKPMNILNPLKWNEFLNAWKRGDFRNQSK